MGLATVRAVWQGTGQAALRGIDFGTRFGRPERFRAMRQALEMVNRAVAFKHLLFSKTGALKLTIDIAGEDEAVVGHRFGPGFQQAKPAWGCVAR